jgi:hypothetical protein
MASGERRVTTRNGGTPSRLRLRSCTFDDSM